ncbi:hypothetical protein BKA70DRAFT_1451291 [Coprinopsis sp. MPI-PUGE-AT-0042]|nr:hypothetical protein BKA70DRAFT_1451291 [Coprinopsis sp. MPI-PUGE-AT-0042]
MVLEAETVAQAFDWAASRNQVLEVDIGILTDKIISLRSTTKDSSREISSLPESLLKTSKAKAKGSSNVHSRAIPCSTSNARGQLDP